MIPAGPTPGPLPRRPPTDDVVRAATASPLALASYAIVSDTDCERQCPHCGEPFRLRRVDADGLATEPFECGRCRRQVKHQAGAPWPRVVVDPTVAPSGS